MKIKARSKLNLFLEVTGKRPNGYHELHSLVVFLDLADELRLSVHTQKDVILNEVKGLNAENNIILKTARLLQSKYNVNKGIKITLQKNIPIGGGLGGGSADAAATIFALNNLWQLNLPKMELYETALQLGADVPACLYSLLEEKDAVIFKGIGEVIEPCPKISAHFVLVNPNRQLLTADVFKNFSGPLHSLKPYKTGDNLKNWTNSLEPSASQLMPEISDVIEVLWQQPDCTLARMTGSGATCFGIFNTEKSATKAASTISSSHPDWFVTTAKS